MSRFATLLLLAGCPKDDVAPESVDPCLPSYSPSVELGTGGTAFVSLDDSNNAFELIHGTQGGYHLLISTSVVGLEGEAPVAATIVGSIDGTELARSTPWLNMRCNSGVGLQSWGTFLIYDDTPEALTGQNTLIEIELEDVDGRTVSDSATVLIVDEEA